MPRICVIGRTGQIASALIEAQGSAGVEIVQLGRSELDLEHVSAEKIGAHLDRIRPDILINAAAYTAVDLAESNRDAAMAINADAPGQFAEASRRLGIPIIHLSTDYVFDGAKSAPHLETDAPNPQNVYGYTKLLGEHAVAAGNTRHLILRTSWVHAHAGRNFVTTMLRLARTMPLIRVVDDQTGCPTHAGDFADAILAMVPRLIAAPAGDPAFGLYHLAGSGSTSWAGLATAIFETARANGRPWAEIVPILSIDYPQPARRPANSRLDCAKIKDVFGIELPAWQDGLARCLKRHFTDNPLEAAIAAEPGNGSLTI